MAKKHLPFSTAGSGAKPGCAVGRSRPPDRTEQTPRVRESDCMTLCTPALRTQNRAFEIATAIEGSGMAERLCGRPRSSIVAS